LTSFLGRPRERNVISKPSLTPGVPYTVRLRFAEIGSVTAAGQRVFNVAANGVSLLSNFDIFAAGGGKAFVAVVRQFTVTRPGEHQAPVHQCRGQRLAQRLRDPAGLIVYSKTKGDPDGIAAAQCPYRKIRQRETG
jgi:hypothetical protein